MEFAENDMSGQQDLGRLPLGRVPLILMYHGVQQVAEDPYQLCVTPERFSEQMRWLAERGLRGVSIDALVEAMRAGKERALVGISFDDGYASVLENAVPELLRHEFTATTLSSRILWYQRVGWRDGLAAHVGPASCGGGGGWHGDRLAQRHAHAPPGPCRATAKSRDQRE